MKTWISPGTGSNFGKSKGEDMNAFLIASPDGTTTCNLGLFQRLVWTCKYSNMVASFACQYLVLETKDIQHCTTVEDLLKESARLKWRSCSSPLVEV